MLRTVFSPRTFSTCRASFCIGKSPDTELIKVMTQRDHYKKECDKYQELYLQEKRNSSKDTYFCFTIIIGGCTLFGYGFLQCLNHMVDQELP